MATVQTSIALYDGVTGTLKNIHKAMGGLLDTFESVQRALGKGIDITSFQAARGEWEKAGAALDSVKENIQGMDQKQRNFNQQVQKGASVADGLSAKFKKIADTIFSLKTAEKVLDLSDSLTNTKARLNNAQIHFADNSSIAETEKLIMASAQRSRSSYLSMADAVAKLGNNAYASFHGMEEIVGFSELINKQFVLGGASAQEQSSVMLQLTQAMSSGVLQGDELRSIFEKAPGVIQNIADYLEVPIGRIREIGANGQITAEIVKNATFAAADEINGKFEQMPQTFAQIWTSFQNNALMAFQPVLQRMNEIANTEAFQSFVSGVVKGLGVVAGIALGIFDLLMGMAGVVVDNWSWIAPLIVVVTTALAAYYSQLLLTKGVELASEAAKKAMAAAQAVVIGMKMLAVPIYAAMTGATMAETAAQWGLNAAMYACPIVWIILLIIALIALLYGAVAAINHFAGTSISATGVICGAVAWLAAVIWNTVIGLLNGIIQLLWTVLVYPFLGIMEWIVNATTGGFDSMGDAAANLVGQLIGWFLSLGQVVTTIIDAIFGTNWTAGLESLKNDVTSWGKNENAITIDKSAPLLDARWDYSSAYQSGYAFGKGIDDKVAGVFDFGGLEAFELGEGMDRLAGYSGDTAANTAAMADSLSYSQEDLAYLKDIAEREAINRFTTAQIHIEQHNENHLAGDADLDGILDAWTNDFAEKLMVSGEGVYE